MKIEIHRPIRRPESWPIYLWPEARLEVALVWMFLGFALGVVVGVLA